MLHRKDSHAFFIYPPPHTPGYVGPIWQICLTPCSSLSCCNMPRTLPRLLCSPVKVSLSSMLSECLPTHPYRNCMLLLFTSSITFLAFICPIAVFLFKYADKCIFAKLCFPSRYSCHRCFVSSKIYFICQK